ncbi:MAG: hypothetical protein Q8O28_10875 [Smithellaceae bacterium]|nr:hypothetical protein [Smithellaceae bacterium]
MYQSLQEFQKFIAERKLAPENQVPFFANWASKFIRFSNALQDKPLNLKIQLFIDDLKNDPKLQDWQIAQAESAINLYIHHFQADNKALRVPEGIPLSRVRVFPFGEWGRGYFM